MQCSVSGCTNIAAHTITVIDGDRTSHQGLLCEKHTPDGLVSAAADRNIEAPDPGPALTTATATVIIDRPATERVEVPMDHPDVKGADVINTTNASGTSGLTGPTEEAKVARANQGGEPKSASESKKAQVKVDTTPSEKV